VLFGFWQVKALWGLQCYCARVVVVVVGHVALILGHKVNNFIYKISMTWSLRVSYRILPK
jgi:hypothetical protein